MKKNFVDNELSEQARATTKRFRKKLASEMSYKSTYNGDALSFDWIDIVEDSCPRSDIIVRNAKVALVQEANVELIEKAKRITVESVKDLARHTNYINKFDEATQSVEPGKILDIRNEETFNIYENRFLHTLIYLLDRFVYEREQEIKKLEVSDNKLLEYKAKSETPKEKVHIEVKITSDTIPSDQVNNDLQEKLKEIQKRIKRIKEYIASWMRSEMIKSLDKAHIPPVKSPIKKTNI